jgi:DNA invertase Pin-like site-specific DNA recombinase
MKYGYARASTDDQSTALQFEALMLAGCKTLFKDEGLSGATTKRPTLLQFDRDSGWRLPVRVRRCECQED